MKTLEINQMENVQGGDLDWKCYTSLAVGVVGGLALTFLTAGSSVLVFGIVCAFNWGSTISSIITCT